MGTLSLLKLQGASFEMQFNNKSYVLEILLFVKKIQIEGKYFLKYLLQSKKKWGKIGS